MTELAGRRVWTLAPAPDGGCLAVVDEKEIWRREAGGAWCRVSSTGISLQSVLSVGDAIFAGGMDEAVLLRLSANGEAERLKGFDHVPGRHEWIGHGPPLGVRGLAATVDEAVVLAAVHVGGIPRSEDRGETWAPTIPVLFDVHEVRAHPSLSNIVVAAAAVGLCVSRDGGRNWRVLAEALEVKHALAAAVLPEEALFSIQDGPFASRSQVWRWRLGGERLEQVRDGLPKWLEGKIDTGHLTANGGRAALSDGGGNLWLSTVGSTGWKRLATGVHANALLIL